MYKINEIATIAGISSRTLRYYDEINLLKPSFINDSNYRIYSEKEMDILQQILFFRRMDLPLNEIKKIISSTDFDFTSNLMSHRENLLRQKENIDILLETINKTINYQKGATTMTSHEKFNGLKEEMIQKNEETYGSEIREKYGDKTVYDFNQKFRKLSKYEMKEADTLAQTILDTLGTLIKENNPTSQKALELCRLHEQWIKHYWTTYSKEGHLALVQMYTEDQRFTAYYDKVGKGATSYLLEAMTNYLK